MANPLLMLIRCNFLKYLQAALNIVKTKKVQPLTLKKKSTSLVAGFNANMSGLVWLGTNLHWKDGICI